MSKINRNDFYPEIKVERPNLEYAKLLLQDYAGTVKMKNGRNLPKH